jgi:hypothetical protein
MSFGCLLRGLQPAPEADVVIRTLVFPKRLLHFVAQGAFVAYEKGLLRPDLAIFSSNSGEIDSSDSISRRALAGCLCHECEQGVGRFGSVLQTLFGDWREWFSETYGLECPEDQRLSA